MVFYFGQIPDHQIAFGEPGHVVLDPTPEPAALPLVRHLCSPSAPHLMPSPRETANTAVLIRGIGVHAFSRTTFREAIQDFWVHRKKNHPGTLVMNLDTYRCGHEQT